MTRRLTLIAALIVALTACGKDKPKNTLEFEPAPVRMQRLLSRQYTHSVRDLVGPAAADVVELPDDVTEEGFAVIGAATLSLSDAAIKQYESSARKVAQVGAHDSAFLGEWVSCTPASAADEDCLRHFVEDFGHAAWRRPLSTDEVDRYTQVAVTAAGDFDDFEMGIEYALAGFLQSPYFIYQVQIGETDPDDPTRRILTSNELATKLSFFLADTTPSVELLQAAADGKLDTDEGLRDIVEEMLAGDAVQASLHGFFEERFHLNKLDTLLKDPDEFPDYDQSLAQAMREESDRLLDYVVWEQDTDFREIFTADYAFVNHDLAELYGVTPPSGTGWIQRTLPPQQERAGLFSQAAFLAIEAHPNLTSPTRRGRAIQERVLCTPIPPPPPDVVAELPPPDPDNPQTMRQILEQHQEVESCAGCHVLMDNIGFGLENYDPIGRYRTFDNGLPIDPSGEVVGVGTFQRASGLADLLYDEPRLTECWVRNTYRQATAHIETDGEREVIDYLNKRFEKSGYRVQDLLVELVTSEPFRVVGQPEGATP